MEEMAVEELGRDRFAVFRLHPDDNTIELEWSEETGSMDKTQFREGSRGSPGLPNRTRA